MCMFGAGTSLPGLYIRAHGVRREDSSRGGTAALGIVVHLLEMLVGKMQFFGQQLERSFGA